MTNFKLSLRLSAMFVLTLAVCCLVVGQAAVADGSGFAEKQYVPISGRHLSTTQSQTTTELNRAYPLDKPASSGRVNVPREDRAGGELIGNATEITALPYSDAAATDGFADDYDEACTYTSTAPDVVYKYTPAVGISVDISLCGSSYDTKLFVYNTDSPAGGDAIACNEDACGSDGYKSYIGGLALTAGTTYYIVVDGYSGSDFGDYVLEVSETPACVVVCPAGATPEGGVCGADNNDGPLGDPILVGAIADGESICGDVWMDGGSRDFDFYEFTLTESKLVTVDGECAGPFDLLLVSSAWAINAVSATSVGCGDVVSVSLIYPAGTYYVAARGQAGEGFPCTAPAAYWLTLTLAEAIEPPANNDCANAIPITEGVYTGTNVGASLDGPYAVGPDVWYCYTATCDGAATASLCDGTDFDTRILAYTGCTCPAVGPYLAYDDDGCGITYGPSSITFTVVAGQSYMIEVAGWGATDFGDFALTMSCTEAGELPVNDSCQNADLRVLEYDVPEYYEGNFEWADINCTELNKPHVWIAFTLTASCSNVSLSYCDATEGVGWSLYSWMTNACPCLSPDEYWFEGVFDGWTTCTSGIEAGAMHWDSLPAGTYYYPVLSHNVGGVGWDYVVTVLAEECPPYCVAGGLEDEYIYSVALNEINNVSAAWSEGGYGDYTDVHSTSLYKGVSYTLGVVSVTTWPEDQCGAWIDYDLDFYFEPEEYYYLGTGLGPFSGTVTPPITAITGETTLRVRLVWDEVPDPCGTYWGEVEDYKIVLKDLPCGDVNFDGLYNEADVTYLMEFYFNSGAAPLPILANGDTNGDCCINIADIVFLADYVNGGGLVDLICLPCNP